MSSERQILDIVHFGLSCYQYISKDKICCWLEGGGYWCVLVVPRVHEHESVAETPKNCQECVVMISFNNNPAIQKYYGSE